MVEKCLNPMCSAKFRKLGDGRLFVKEVSDLPCDGSTEHSHKLAYFWLCKSCCRTMTVVAEKGKEVNVAPLRAPVTATSEKPESTDRPETLLFHEGTRVNVLKVQ